MKNQTNKATVKDGLTTSHNVLSDAYQRHGWLFQPDVLPSGACPHERIAMEAMQSYSDQQNAELRERVKELEAENTRCRDRIGEALKFLLSRQQTTPGLGAPVTILKQSLER